MKIECQMLYLPDETSGVIEICFDGLDFMHIKRGDNGEFVTIFLPNEKFVALSDSQLMAIMHTAHLRLVKEGY
jgi:hypothetical protein